MGFETLVTNEGLGRLYDGSGGYWQRGCNTELLVLNTSGSPGDPTLSTGDLLPEDSVIEAVTARIVTTLVDATEWMIGDETMATRFASSMSTVVAGTTVVGLNQHLEQGVSPPAGTVQTAAGKVSITVLTTPSAGVVRVSVYYSKFVAPTS